MTRMPGAYVDSGVRAVVGRGLGHGDLDPFEIGERADAEPAVLVGGDDLHPQAAAAVRTGRS